MALNLWKIGGKPTSYNPLPIGTTNRLDSNEVGKWTLSCRAKSASNAVLQLSDQVTISKNFNLTNNFQTCSLDFTNFHPIIIDLNNNGDIVIDSITIVRQPLPNLTINGVDGFLSGKWIYDNGSPAGNGGCGHLTIVDDTTATLNNTDGLWRSGFVQFDAQPNTTYTYSGTYSYDNGLINVPVRIDSLSSGQTGVNGGTVIVNSSSGGTGNLKYTFTTPSDCKQICLYLQSDSISNLTLRNPVVNVGSKPTPYSKKTGTKMVIPTPEKNLFIGFKTITPNIANISTYTITDDQHLSFTSTATTGQYFSYDVPYKYNGSPYTLSVTHNGKIALLSLDSSGNIVDNSGWISSSSIFITPKSNTVKLRLMFGCDSLPIGTFNFSYAQVEAGTTQTPYAPYQVQLNKTPQRVNANGQPTTVSSKTGMKFNGSNTTDYINHGNVDFSTYKVVIAEMDFMINAYPGAGFGNLMGKELAFKFRYDTSGSLSFLISFDGVTWGLTYNAAYGFALNTRYKVKLVMDFNQKIAFFYANGNLIVSPTMSGNSIGANSNNFNVDSYNNGSDKAMITLYSYKVTCDGNVLYSSDLTNPQNIQGTTVLQSQPNLIPSFADPRWTIHPNAKVMGKDVLHLDATSSDNSSIITLPVDGSKRFELALTTNGRWTVHFLDANQNYLNGLGWQTGNSYIFKASDYTASSVYYFKIWIGNPSAGSFDFVKPQLYQLTGQEGTINGNPVQLNKPSKRNLYAKR